MSTCSSRGGAARAPSSRSGRPSGRATASVRIVDADGVDRTAALPELAGHGRPCRRALGDPRRRAGGRRRATGGRTAPSSARRLAGETGRPVAFLAFDLLHLDGRALLRSRSSRGARRCAASCGPATRSSPCRPSPPRAGAVRGDRGPGAGRDDGAPASGPIPARACAAGCGGSSPRRRPCPRPMLADDARASRRRPRAPVLALISRLPLDDGSARRCSVDRVVSPRGAPRR